jgi:hypothetical protein
MDDENPSGGRKRSKSCSDSDELVAIDDQLRSEQLPTSGDSHKLSKSKQRRGVIPGRRLSDPLVSDEETPRPSVRNPRTSPHPMPHVHAIPPAGPLSLQGRERLENAFQEVHTPHTWRASHTHHHTRILLPRVCM